jgi:hypothetical protein
MNKFLSILFIGVLTVSCSDNSIEKKGFQVSEISEDESGQKVVGLKMDSLKLETRPRNVLLTFNAEHRLTPIYKVNYDKKTKKPFTGSNAYHTNWNDNYGDGNKWNNNFMPGFEAVYGYNFVNVSHYNNSTNIENKLFDEPVLIKTLYYPAFSKDTLNYKPVKRVYYMVSVYDEDSNKDGFINAKDLRRFYHFDINGLNKTALIPKEYSVMSSEYDSANDIMYVFAKKDKNQNGQMESDEPTDIFWIDLDNPENVGKQYKTE